MSLFISGAAFDLTLSAGGIKYALEARGSSFQNYIGTSSGSYLALALVLGYQPDDLMDWMEANTSRLESDLKFSYLRLFWSGYLISTKGRSDFISRMIKGSPIYKKSLSGLDPSRITFKDLAGVASSNFICNAFCLDSFQNEVFSLWTSPDLSVHTAVSASMSLLASFEPTTLPDGFKYIDGAYGIDYLPIVFDPTSESYYKIKYPNADIPIDLDSSWGCLNSSPLDLTGLTPTVSPAWSFKSLFKTLNLVADFVKAAQLRQSPRKIIQDRTWVIYDTQDIETFPDVATGRRLYQEGYDQAQKIGPLGL